MTNFVDQLADTIKIAGYDFTIEKWSNAAAIASQRYGECSIFEQTLRIATNIATRHKAVNTVLHEISHAIYWAYGIDDEDEQERIVNTFGSAWMQVYRDNPWLLVWLQTALNAEQGQKP